MMKHKTYLIGVLKRLCRIEESRAFMKPEGRIVDEMIRLQAEIDCSADAMMQSFKRCVGRYDIYKKNTIKAYGLFETDCLDYEEGGKKSLLQGGYGLISSQFVTWRRKCRSLERLISKRPECWGVAKVEICHRRILVSVEEAVLNCERHADIRGVTAKMVVDSIPVLGVELASNYIMRIDSMTK